MLTNKNRKNLDVVAKGKFLPSVKEFCQMAITFSLTVFAWIFFRAENVNHAFGYIGGIFNTDLFSSPMYFVGMKRTILLIGIFLVVEWAYRREEYGLKLSNIQYTPLRWFLYYVIIMAILEFNTDGQAFIYFQF